MQGCGSTSGSVTGRRKVRDSRDKEKMSAGLRAIVVALTLMVGGAFLPPTVVRSGAVLGAKSGLQARISEQRTLQVSADCTMQRNYFKQTS